MPSSYQFYTSPGPALSANSGLSTVTLPSSTVEVLALSTHKLIHGERRRRLARDTAGYNERLALREAAPRWRRWWYDSGYVGPEPKLSDYKYVGREADRLCVLLLRAVDIAPEITLTVRDFGLLWDWTEQQ